MNSPSSAPCCMSLEDEARDGTSHASGTAPHEAEFDRKQAEPEASKSIICVSEDSKETSTIAVSRGQPSRHSDRDRDRDIERDRERDRDIERDRDRDSIEANTFQSGAIEPLSWLHFVPSRSGVVGSYGGGEAMSSARQILLRPARSPAVVPQPLPLRIRTAVEGALAAHHRTPPSQRIARLPAALAERDWRRMQWSAGVQISSRVYGEISYNMMYHGFLFGEVANDPTRLGYSSPPSLSLPPSFLSFFLSSFLSFFYCKVRRTVGVDWRCLSLKFPRQFVCTQRSTH